MRSLMKMPTNNNNIIIRFRNQTSFGKKATWLRIIKGNNYAEGILYYYL